MKIITYFVRYAMVKNRIVLNDKPNELRIEKPQL